MAESNDEWPGLKPLTEKGGFKRGEQVVIAAGVSDGELAESIRANLEERQQYKADGLPPKFKTKMNINETFGAMASKEKEMLEYSTKEELENKLTAMSKAGLDSRLDLVKDKANYSLGWDGFITEYFSCIRENEEGMFIETNIHKTVSEYIGNSENKFSVKRGYIDAYEMITDIMSRAVYVDPETSLSSSVLLNFIYHKLQEYMHLVIQGKNFIIATGEEKTSGQYYTEGWELFFKELEKHAKDNVWIGESTLRELVPTKESAYGSLGTITFHGTIAPSTKCGLGRVYVNSGYSDAHDRYISIINEFIISDIKKPVSSIKLSVKTSEFFKDTSWNCPLPKTATEDERDQALAGCQKALDVSCRLLETIESESQRFGLGGFISRLHDIFNDKASSDRVGVFTQSYMIGIKHGIEVITNYLRTATGQYSD